jgi:hypothetical protein
LINTFSQEKSSSSGRQRGPQLIGKWEVVPVSGEPGLYERVADDTITGELTLLLECNAKNFPFDGYCRFVRHAGQGRPYTFPNMEFHEAPPGIRLGPWPGWRGIPGFPTVSVRCGSAEISLQPTFWGDETWCGLVRLFGRLPGGVEGEVKIRSYDPEIVPRLLSAYQTSAVKARKRPVKLLPELRGVHPRLLITPDLLPQLGVRALGSHRRTWDKILSLRASWHLPFEKDPESKCVGGPERLSSYDRVLISALIALTTGRQEDIRQALDAYREYLIETGRPEYEPLGIDTQAGETLFILAVGYDWLYNWIPEEERRAAWRQIENVAGKCSSFLTPDRTDYGQAHYLGCGLGLVAYSLLALESDPAAADRAAGLRGALECALSLLSDDGSYPHGISLWIYEFGFLLRWIELFRVCAGEDLWPLKRDALENASAFRAATLSADARYGLAFGDPQYRVGGDSWCHFLIASRTGSATAQWKGEELLDLPHEGVDFRNIPARRRVYEFLFFDPDVQSKVPPGGVHVFADTGQVVIRSTRTIFTMRSGLPIGRTRYEAGEYGAYGHSDPANGAFLIEHAGRFIASGPGPVYRRDTSLHNVVTIDGKGQVGDSTVWLPDFFPPEMLPPVLQATHVGSSASVFADLTKSYLPHLGVEKYTRALFIDPERMVAGVDSIELAVERSIEWNVHSRLPLLPKEENGVSVCDFGDGVRFVMFSPMNISWAAGITEFIPAYPNDGVRDFACVARLKGNRVRFIWCYLFGPASVPVFSGDRDGRFRLECEGGEVLVCDGSKFYWRDTNDC